MDNRLQQLAKAAPDAPLHRHAVAGRGRDDDHRPRGGVSRLRHRRAAATSTASPASTASTSAIPTARRSPPPPPAQMARLPFTSNWTVAHPPAIELAAKLAELAPGGPRARLLHLGRGGIGRVGLEDGGPVPPGQRRTGAAQGDRPPGRLPRGDDGGAGDDRAGGMPDAVRAVRRPRRPRRQHQRLPAPGRRRPGAAAGRAAGRGRGDDRARGRRRRSRC